MLRDLLDDDNRLRPRPAGLGRLLPDDSSPVTVAVDASYSPYEVVGTSVPYSAPAPVVEVSQQPVSLLTGRASGGAIRPALQLPQFDFATSVASCGDGANCDGASTPAATSATASLTTSPASAAATVTPLPAAPKTVNWLLLLVAGGLTYALVKSSTPTGGLGCPAPEPAPAAQPLGAPPRRRPAPKRKHVASLKIS